MCAAKAVVTNQVAPKTPARTIIAHGMPDVGTAGSSRCACGGAFGTRKRLSGRPMTMCNAAHAKQAPRQPKASIIAALSGQPMVLAKPANRVMPVIALRACRPHNPATVANAASYRPKPMPAPMTSQARASVIGPVATASKASPAANIRLVATSTSRPPLRSIMRPASGPSKPDTSSATENMAKNHVLDRCRSSQMGSANTAGT
jgi:hypothetical protein